MGLPGVDHYRFNRRAQSLKVIADIQHFDLYRPSWRGKGPALGARIQLHDMARDLTSEPLLQAAPSQL